MSLTFDTYQEKAMSTAIYGAGAAVNYPILGLVGEAGELANKYKKVLRDNGGVMSQETKQALAKELGDVLWYCAAVARDLGVRLESIAVDNLHKLALRKATGTIGGSGDDREKQVKTSSDNITSNTALLTNYVMSSTDKVKSVEIPDNGNYGN